MATLPVDSYASLGVPLWLSNPVSNLQIQGTPPLTLTNSNGQLAANNVILTGEPTNWSAYPTLSNEIDFNSNDKLQVIGNDLYFNNQILAVASNISNVSDWYLYNALAKVNLNSNVGIDFNGIVLNRTSSGAGTELQFGTTTLNASRWSTYKALQNVDYDGYAMNNVTSITGKTGTSNVTINSFSNIVNTASNAILNTADLVFLTGTTTNPLTSPAVNVRSSNGTRGRINLLAGPGSAGIGGLINITAQGGSAGPVGFGGDIELVATTPVGISNVTSAIKSSASCITSYAGVTSAIGSTFGYNYIHGDVGVNITAGAVSIVPNVPGTNYLYGTLGTAIDNGLYTDHIYPYTNTLTFPNLKITGNSLTGADVEISNVVKFDGDNCITTGINQMTMSGVSPAISNVTTLAMTSGAITGVSTINGFPYNPVRNWANFPAVSTIDASNNDITRVKQLRLTTDVGNTSGFQLTAGAFGSDVSCCGTIDTGLSNGNFRTRELVLSTPFSYPLNLIDDLKLTNVGTFFDSKKRIAVQSSPSILNPVAYLSDIPMAHISLWNVSNVVQTVSNVPVAFTYTNSNAVSGFIVGGSQIYPQQTGTYVVTFSIQFARSSGGTATLAEAWLRLDGVDIPDTNTRVVLPSGANGETVMTVPFSLDISFGSYLEVIMGTPDYTNTIARAIPARTTPYAAPSIPSIIVNIDQVG